jgi:hypothetical protein
LPHPSPRVTTIPSSDGAFKAHVDEIAASVALDAPASLEKRLRRLYPRVKVRARGLAGEGPTWYVYRDGGWRPEIEGPWWTEERMPRIESTLEGWLVAANVSARGLLGIALNEPLDRYFSDYVAPGTLEDASSLFAIVSRGNTLTAAVRVRPTTGDVIAVELRAWREGDRIVGVFRLANDIERERPPAVPMPELACTPEDDVVFAAYARQLVDRMPEPTPAELSLRLRRLYPHAAVEEADGGWHVTRDARGGRAEPGWWADESLPSVIYTSDGLIVDANEAARSLLGPTIVGRHWQELVTPGTDNQVSRIIELIEAAGGAVSKFRMPGADGALVEFDSFTEVQAAGGTLRTVMRPRSE